MRFIVEGIGVAENTEVCWNRLPSAYLPARGLVGMADVVEFELTGAVSGVFCF